MSDEPKYDLEQIQRWMQAVIVHPLGIEQGIASEDARRHVDIDPADVERVVTRSKALSAVERLGVYGYAYYARLLECLKEEFPAVLHAVGEDAFSSFALGYLQKYPSRSYTLFELGAKFPQYLDETRPTGERQAEDHAVETDTTQADTAQADIAQTDTAQTDGAADSWIQFVIDLATFERTVGEIFDGPGPEDGVLLKAEQLSALDGQQFLAARLLGVECLRLLALRFPVDAFYKAARRKEEVPPPDPAETFLAVTRVNYTVCHHALTRPAYELLAALLTGQCVADAMAQAADASADGEEELVANLPTWFSDWAARGYFRAIELAG